MFNPVYKYLKSNLYYFNLKVDFIQEAVLQMITEVYPDVRIITHDICDDAHEKCYSMFVRNDVKRYYCSP